MQHFLKKKEPDLECSTVVQELGFFWKLDSSKLWRFTAKARSPDRLSGSIISDTFNQTSCFSAFYVLLQTSSPPGTHASARNKHLHLRSLSFHIPIVQK